VACAATCEKVNPLELGGQYGRSIFEAAGRVYLSRARFPVYRLFATDTPQQCNLALYLSSLHVNTSIESPAVHCLASTSPFTAILMLKKPWKSLRRSQSRGETSKKNDPRTQFDEPRCLDAAYDNPEFRRWAAKETYVFLRQMKPDLLPWRWNDGVWSTNTPTPDGTLLGGCTYMQNNTGRANEDISSLVLRSVVNVYWECSRCSHCQDEHHVLVSDHEYIFLGTACSSGNEWLGTIHRQ